MPLCSRGNDLGTLINRASLAAGLEPMLKLTCEVLPADIGAPQQQRHAHIHLNARPHRH
jgi:hypothetical protein